MPFYYAGPSCTQVKILCKWALIIKMSLKDHCCGMCTTVSINVKSCRVKDVCNWHRWLLMSIYIFVLISHWRLYLSVKVQVLVQERIKYSHAAKCTCSLALIGFLFLKIRYWKDHQRKLIIYIWILTKNLRTPCTSIRNTFVQPE